MKQTLSTAATGALLAVVVALAASGPVLSFDAGQASVSLSNAGGALTQTSNTSWTLSETGAVNATAKTVVWTITATEGAIVGGHLTIDGFMNVANSGSGPATIGNIVVNLQTYVSGSWVTQASDIADSTYGDAATFAYISPKASSEHKNKFTESTASGSLSFTDAKTNTMFSIAPAITIAAGSSINMLFAASFKNNVLKLPDGTQARAEVIVSFGNGQSWDDSNIDINGNGQIDGDEHHVRSVATRFISKVPATIAANSTPTLTDSAADIVSTGTVTLGTPTFTLGATGGTSSVTFTGGTGGGTITDCAHLTGSGSTTVVGGFTFHNEDGFSEQACDSETVGPTFCTPGTVGCGWQDGDMLTYGQGDWSSGTAANLIMTDYYTVYASTGGLLEVGIPGTAGFSMLWDNPTDLIAFFPETGATGILTSDLLDPTSSASGDFGGNVAALRLNVDFGDAGLVGGASGLHLGDLTLCGFTSVPAFNGMTVRQFEAAAETELGGGAQIDAVLDLDITVASLNAAFASGMASVFAQQHLVNGACP